jgi:hypothetical protein
VRNGEEERCSGGSSIRSRDPGSTQDTYVWKTDSSWAGTCRQCRSRHSSLRFYGPTCSDRSSSGEAGSSSRHELQAPGRCCKLVDRIAVRAGWRKGGLGTRVFRHTWTAARLRHRSEVVEFRIEQHLEALKDRLGNVGFVTRNVTREGAGVENEEPRDTEVSTGEDLPEWARRDSSRRRPEANARPLAPEPPEASDGQRPSA